MSQNRLHNELHGIRIAVASGSTHHRNQLQRVFERIGLRVVLNEPFSDIFVAKIDVDNADVMLIELDEQNEKHDQLLEKLLESTDVPVIFNDFSTLVLNEPAWQGKWFGALMGKIAEITGCLEWETPDINLGGHTTNQALSEQDQSNRPASQVWVLGASLGGPDAVKRFLARLPADLPAALIFAQHLGSNFEPLLAQQLDRITSLHVMPARAGHLVQHGEVIVVPVNRRLRINPNGVIELLPLATASFYTPSVDTVVTDIACRYGGNSGAIIFSGMCDDGVLGVQAMHAKGGQVWTQDPDTCVISAMPDHVRNSGVCGYTGNPEQLAAKLIKYLDQKQAQYG